MSWEFLCSLDLPTYPSLVREFYSSLTRGSGGFTYTIRGVPITIIEILVSRILQMSNEGITPSTHSDKESTLKLILGRDEVNPLEVISVGQLSIEMRLLHNFISRIFIPRTGRFDWVSEWDLAFMKKVIKGEAINLPYIMISQMKKTTRKANTCLPYGMVFILLFEAAHVNLEGEDNRQLHHTDTYSTKSLIRMGYHLSNGQWKKKISR